MFLAKQAAAGRRPNGNQQGAVLPGYVGRTANHIGILIEACVRGRLHDFEAWVSCWRQSLDITS
jgi:hypothetical protein